MSKDVSLPPIPVPPRTSRARVWQKEWDPMPWDNKRRTAQTETTEETFRMQEERLRNKREARMRRYRGYQVYYYGSPFQKQHKMFANISIAKHEGLLYNCYNCRDETRCYLKDQLDLIERPHQKFVKMVEESRQLAEEDRKEAELEKQKQLQKRSHMMKFRDDNKMVGKHVLC